MTLKHHIDRNFECVECGYNLRGLDKFSNCPECGTSVWYTIDALRKKPQHRRRFLKLNLVGWFTFAVVITSPEYDYNLAESAVMLWLAWFPLSLIPLGIIVLLALYFAWLMDRMLPKRNPWPYVLFIVLTMTAYAALLLALNEYSAWVNYHNYGYFGVASPVVCLGSIWVCYFLARRPTRLPTRVGKVLNPTWTTSRDLDNQVAGTLEVDPRLLSVIPELLEDLTELGCDADQVVAALKKTGIKPGAKVLDLGCGKGAAAVELADQLGLQVEGVDALPQFVESARSLAADRGVGSQCKFTCKDIRKILGTSASYDMVMLLSVGPISGDHDKTLNDLRQLVKPGGYIVIDDAYLAEGVQPIPPYEKYVNHDETIRRLIAHGDRLVQEFVYSQSETKRVNETNTELIRRRADSVKHRHPQFAELIDQYVARQVKETKTLGTDMICALWVLERVD